MKRSGAMVVVCGATLALLLGGCSPQTPAAPVSSSASVIGPVVMSVEDLQGATVELAVGQSLDITTGDLPVDSYRGDVEDASVAEFVEGRDDGSATFNPGVTAVAEGTTGVTLSNQDGGIEDVVFTVTVDAAGAGRN